MQRGGCNNPSNCVSKPKNYSQIMFFLTLLTYAKTKICTENTLKMHDKTISLNCNIFNQLANTMREEKFRAMSLHALSTAASCAAKAACATRRAADGEHAKGIHIPHSTFQEELRDAIPVTNCEGLVALVDEQNLNLATIIVRDEASQNIDAEFECQARSRRHAAVRPGGHYDNDARANERPFAWGYDEILPGWSEPVSQVGAQIEARPVG